MIKILIPLGGKSTFFESTEYQYPKPLIEISGKPMIQHVIDNFEKIKTQKQFIFIIKSEDCEKFHVDNVIRLLTNGNTKIYKVSESTKGAVCSALMAIEDLQEDQELIIANGDQVIDIDFCDVLKDFHNKDADAGVITFESVHPKWSYVKLDTAGQVEEFAEKRPISKFAIAGFYYYKSAKFFVNAAFNLIEKDANIEGNYYIAPTMNELILQNKNIVIYPINNDRYHSFYSPSKVKEFEREYS